MPTAIAKLVESVRSYLVEEGGAGVIFNRDDFLRWAAKQAVTCPNDELERTVRRLLSRGTFKIYLDERTGRYVVAQPWD